MFPEMITKLLNILFPQTASNHPWSRFQPRCEWQSEFLFVPAKSPLRYDAIQRPMTGVAIERVAKNSNSRSL